MKSASYQLVLDVAKSIQERADELFLPLPETRRSRSEMVLPLSLFKGTRGYIEKVVYQINTTYEQTCYDACAVMIRRLVEMLIIEAFENQRISSKIKNTSGDFFYLRELITRILLETSWNLGRNTKTGLNHLKDIGDKSAHSRRYNAHRKYIDDIVSDLRTVTEELLYVSGLRR